MSREKVCEANWLTVHSMQLKLALIIFECVELCHLTAK